MSQIVFIGASLIISDVPFFISRTIFVTFRIIISVAKLKKCKDGNLYNENRNSNNQGK